MNAPSAATSSIMPSSTRASKPPGSIWPWAGAVILAGALLPIARPFLSSGFPWGHDTATHLANVFRFNRALAGGEFPVRWARGLAPGHEQPVFNFYQVGFYYLVAAVHALGVPLSAAFKAVPVVLWWSGAGLTFLWLRPWGRMPAISGAAVFALSPYVIIDGFIRAAYPELAAIVFAVGALWAADEYLRRARPFFAGLFALFVALMLVSHLPATLIAAPALLVELLVVGLGLAGAARRIAVLAGAAVCGAGMAAFYVIPAFAEMPLVQMHELTEGNADFRQQFVPASQWVRYVWSYSWNYFGTSVTDPAHLMPVQVGVLQWAAILGAAGLILWSVLRRRFGAVHAQAAAWLLAAGLSLFMMHRASAAIWERLPLLAFLQFPWRFFALLSIACAALIAILLSRIRREALQALAMFLVLGVSIHLYDRRLMPYEYIARADMNIDDPRWADRLEHGRRSFEEPGYDPAGAAHDAAPASRWTLVDGAAVISEDISTDAVATARVDASAASRVRLNIAAFPGWRVRVDGVRVQPAATPEGYQMLTIEPGRHRVEAVFTNTWIRTLANAASLVSIAFVALVAAAAPIRRSLAR